VSSAIAVAACNGDGDQVTPTTSSPPTTTTEPEPTPSDGQLTIGVLLPTSDSVIGDPMIEGIETAIARINQAGGVLGTRVRTTVVDEGATSASAASGIQTLLDRNVDAVVGPGSSLLTLATLDDIVGSGTLACSPTASALALDGFPDDGLFFRTMPSDSLQARAIAEATDQTGALSATIVHVDDAYGRGLAGAVEAAMDPGVLTEAVHFSGRDDDLGDEARALIASGAPVAIVLANGDDALRYLETLNDVDTSGLTTIFVNDAMRNPPNPQRIASLDDELRRKIVGVGPLVESSDASAPYDPPGVFATYAYDCVNLIALAAVRADSDDPREIAAQMASVSSSGQVCATFADCVAAIEAGRQVDYDGPTGVTELSARTGDPSQAYFDRFVFGPDGNDEFVRSVVVGT